jgi:hypothetical protein
MMFRVPAVSTSARPAIELHPAWRLPTTEDTSRHQRLDALTNGDTTTMDHTRLPPMTASHSGANTPRVACEVSVGVAVHRRRVR